MRLLRILKILKVVIVHRLDNLIPDKRKLPWLVRIALSPLAILPAVKTHPAISLRLAIEELGPVFIKFGQILSTRKDLFSNAYSVELAKLQDQVPAFDSVTSRALLNTHC